jgi:hypothetical protein
MGSKRKGGKKRSGKNRAEDVIKLSRKAKVEVKKLLKRTKAGTLTQVKLETGLEEVEGRLKKMLGMIRYFL